MLKFGLIGETLTHSFSPEIHKKLFMENNIDGTYELIEIPRNQLFENFQQLKSEYTGINVTIPYKEKVIPFLDNLSPEARYIGAVNTVLFSQGQATGYNTDYFGFMGLLEQNQVTVKGKEVMILGSGGASKAVVKALLDMGSFDITIVSSSKQSFNSQYTISYEYFREIRQPYDILINCTPVGMHPHENLCPVDKSLIYPGKILIDLIYNPEKTLFLKYGEAQGCKSINGRTMLYEQAKMSQHIWLHQA